jgi:hypothetical protein
VLVIANRKLGGIETVEPIGRRETKLTIKETGVKPGKKGRRGTGKPTQTKTIDAAVPEAMVMANHLELYSHFLTAESWRENRLIRRAADTVRGD